MGHFTLSTRIPVKKYYYTTYVINNTQTSFRALQWHDYVMIFLPVKIVLSATWWKIYFENKHKSAFKLPLLTGKRV